MTHLELVLLVLCALALLIAVRATWRAGAAGRRIRASAARGRAAETEAERLLERAGYRILERQVRAVVELRIDDEVYAVDCRVDLLVGHGERVLAAEVKSGAVHADPTHPATRRQLLEYLLAFEVDGVLLVDMAERRIRRVAFPALAG